MKRIFFASALIFLFSITCAYAAEPDRIISNSEDWKDVYSIITYGNLIEKPAVFLRSDRHGTLILNSIPTEQHIWAISSKKLPYLPGYKSLLESRGYTSEEFIYENANLELARKLTEVNRFIVLDDSYGYNAISVAPYAAITKSYVLFADRTNIRDIDRFLSSRDVEKLIVYGNVDREVKSALDKYRPEIINKEGDRFLNNIEIVKKYQEIKHAKQAVLTNGEFIEQAIMSGAEPVIFIGTGIEHVPDVVTEYVKSSDIQVGVLIGNELVGAATIIRRQMGISVFVKFAQGARNPEGAISQVEALDMFPLPTYILNLEVQSIKYNKASGQLEVTIKNTEAQAAYAIGTYSLTASDGSRQTVGDVGANFIDGNEMKTFTYEIEALPEGDISVDIFIIYGESKGSLEKEIRQTVSVETVRVLDECELNKDPTDDTPALLNLNSNTFYIEVENIGTKDCYVDGEIIDIIIDDQRDNYGADEILLVPSGSKKSLEIQVEDMEEEDLLDNEKIKARIFYGERETALVKVIEKEYIIKLKKFDLMQYALYAVIIILIILVLWKRKKKKEEEKRKHAAAHTPHHENK